MKNTVSNWLSSDYHLKHFNILKYDKRDFKTIEDHDIHLIQTHNKYVKPHDNFYFLGDFSFGKKDITEYYLSQLNGNKYFIKGNHDDKDTVALYKQYGTFMGKMEEIRIGEQKITLCHFAQRVWNQSHRGSWSLHAHSHDSLERYPWGKSMDVGVVTAKRILGEYRPFEFNEIKTILDKREILKVDNH